MNFNTASRSLTGCRRVTKDKSLIPLLTGCVWLMYCMSFLASSGWSTKLRSIWSKTSCNIGGGVTDKNRIGWYINTKKFTTSFDSNLLVTVCQRTISWYYDASSLIWCRCNFRKFEQSIHLADDELLWFFDRHQGRENFSSGSSTEKEPPKRRWKRSLKVPSHLAATLNICQTITFQHFEPIKPEHIPQSMALKPKHMHKKIDDHWGRIGPGWSGLLWFGIHGWVAPLRSRRADPWGVRDQIDPNRPLV